MDCTTFRAGMPLSKCADCGRTRPNHEPLTPEEEFLYQYVKAANGRVVSEEELGIALEKAFPLGDEP